MINKSLKESLTKKLAEVCQKKNVPGMALIAAKNGEVIFEDYFGYRDVANKSEVTSETIFPAASVTKSFTTLSVMILADQGKLSPDDLVIDWLPALKLPEAQYEKDLKVHHLLSNSSGFPGLGAVNRARANSIQADPDGAYMANRLSYNVKGDPIQNVNELIEVMSNQITYQLLGKPGTTFNYSNEGFALLQGIIERASNQSFPNFVKKHIFDPLEMNHSAFTLEDLPEKKQVTEIYGYKEDGTAFHSPSWWDVGHIYTNGSLKTTVVDLIKYLEIYRQNGTVNGKKIISSSFLKQMTSPQATVPTGEKYGYGLKLTNYQGIKLIGHPGIIKGGSAYIMYAPELALTFAVLTNIGEFSAESLALLALREIAALPESAPPKMLEMDVEQLEEYLGLYTTAEGRKIEIKLQSHQLLLTARNGKTIISPLEKDSFITPEGGKYQFLRFENGEIAGLSTGFRFIPKAISDEEALQIQLNKMS